MTENLLEDWQLGEIHAGLADLDEGREVSHERVAKWLASWGNPEETKPSAMKVIWSRRSL